MEINGLPLHPLVVHAAVVGIPATAMLAIALAVLPRWRWLVRWPVAVAAVLSVATGYLATRSGSSLLTSRPELRPLVKVHEHRGEQLATYTLVLGIVVLVSAFVLPGPSALASGRGARPSRVAVLDRVLPVLLIVVALLVLVQVYLTGDSGARAVWG